MKRIYKFLYIIFIILFISCEKEKENDNDNQTKYKQKLQYNDFSSIFNFNNEYQLISISLEFIDSSCSSGQIAEIKYKNSKLTEIIEYCIPGMIIPANICDRYTFNYSDEKLTSLSNLSFENVYFNYINDSIIISCDKVEDSTIIIFNQNNINSIIHYNYLDYKIVNEILFNSYDSYINIYNKISNDLLLFFTYCKHRRYYFSNNYNYCINMLNNPIITRECIINSNDTTILLTNYEYLYHNSNFPERYIKKVYSLIENDTNIINVDTVYIEYDF